MTSEILEKISDEIRNLSESEQLLLASRILERLVSQKTDTKGLDLRDLRNTGEGVWAEQYIQAYIDEERNGWER